MVTFQIRVLSWYEMVIKQNIFFKNNMKSYDVYLKYFAQPSILVVLGSIVDTYDVGNGWAVCYVVYKYYNSVVV